MALAKGEAGIFEKEAAPTLTQFKPRLVEHWKAKHEHKPHTLTFYKEKLARKWKIISAASLIERLPGEGRRDFVLSYEQEPIYLEACPQPLRDVAILILESGLRPSEALNLTWDKIRFRPAHGAKFGFMHIEKGKSRNARRNLSLTKRVSEMLMRRRETSGSKLVFPGENPDAPFLVTSLDHQHEDVRTALKLRDDFVPHSLRHTMLTLWANRERMRSLS